MGVSMKAGRGVPPVVDQHVERVERLDLVPPQGRVDQHVAGLELGHLGGGQGIAETRDADRNPVASKSTMLTTWPPGVGSSGPG
jgi:hypothetical protein